MSRTRSTVNVSPVEVASVQGYSTNSTKSAPPVWVVTGSPFSRSYNALDEQSEMVDVVTQEYGRKSAEGEIINNPMTQTYTKITKDEPVFTREVCGTNGSQWAGLKWTGSMALGGAWEGCLLDAPDLGKTSLIDQAVTDAFAKMDFSEAQALTTIAEANKSVVSLVQIFKRLVKIAKYVKRLNVRGLIGELKPNELANRYMEVRYAIRPLVYDVRTITNALAAKPKKANRFTFRGFKSRTGSDSASGTVITDANTYWRALRTVERTVEVRSGVLCAIEAITKLNTWGFDQPIETMWELTPFSFVFDWFANIGQTIASWTPEMGLSTLASWYVVTDTTYQTLEEHDSSNRFLPNDYSNYLFWGATMTKLTRVKERVPDPNRSIIPHFSLRLDALKLLDLAIILKGLVKGR